MSTNEKPPSVELSKPSRVVSWVYGVFLIALAAIPVCVTEMLDKGEDKWFLIRTLGPVMAVILILHALGKPLKSKGLDPLAFCAIAWVGVQLLSMIDAHNVGVSLVVVTRQVGLLGFFFVARYYAGRTETNRYTPIFYVLILMGFLTAVYGTFQHFGFDYIDWEVNDEVPIDRGVSFMGHATFAASVLILILPLTFAMALTTASRGLRYGLFAASLVMLYHLSFSGARVATLAFFLSMGIGMCLWIYTRLKASDRSLPEGFRLKAVVALMVCALLGGGMMYRAWQLKGSDLFGLTEGGMAQRICAWETANRVFLANPVNGIGVGHYEIVSPEYWNVVESSRFVQFERMLYQPHNDFLEAAAEMGLPGVMCLLALVIFGLCQSYALIPRYRFLAIGLLTAVLASILDSCFIFAWQVAEPGLYFWVILGVISGLYCRNNAETADA